MGTSPPFFADSVDALGVTLDLSNSIAAEALVKNTSSRDPEDEKSLDCASPQATRKIGVCRGPDLWSICEEDFEDDHGPDL